MGATACERSLSGAPAEMRARSRGFMTQDDRAIHRRMTLEGVARIAGVSRATASRVVNGSPKVNPDSRRAVDRRSLASVMFRTGPREA